MAPFLDQVHQVAGCQHVSLLVTSQDASTFLNLIDTLPQVDQNIVGRDAEVAKVVSQLQKGPGARMWIHGMPGVGKDTVAVNAMRQPLVMKAFPFQAWLPGSSNVAFCSKLVDMFDTHVPEAKTNEAKTSEEKLGLVRAWLQQEDGWFFYIEDFTPNCLEAITLLSDEKTQERGCVVITSKGEHFKQLPRGSAQFSPENILPLGLLSETHCLQIWIRMRVFGEYNEDTVDMTEEAKRSQFVEDAIQDTGKKNKKVDIDSVDTCLDFFKTRLGNLPLSVQLCGYLIRNGTSLKQLIEAFSFKDVDGSNCSEKMIIRNGLKTSVRLGVRSMLLEASSSASSSSSSLEKEEEEEEEADFTMEDRFAALQLLATMAMLPQTQTPYSLLLLCRTFPLDRLEKAEELLEMYGLKPRSPAGMDHVSFFLSDLHQQVQESIKEVYCRPFFRDGVGEDGRLVKREQGERDGKAEEEEEYKGEKKETLFSEMDAVGQALCEMGHVLASYPLNQLVKMNKKQLSRGGFLQGLACKRQP